MKTQIKLLKYYLNLLSLRVAVYFSFLLIILFVSGCKPGRFEKKPDIEYNFDDDMTVYGEGDEVFNIEKVSLINTSSNKAYLFIVKETRKLIRFNKPYKFEELNLEKKDRYNELRTKYFNDPISTIKIKLLPGESENLGRTYNIVSLSKDYPEFGPPLGGSIATICIPELIYKIDYEIVGYLESTDIN